MNFFTEYGKFTHPASKVEIQTKLEEHAKADFLEFSCGCCIKIDDCNKQYQVDGRDTFVCFLNLGLKKLYNWTSINATDSLWRSNCFPKTAHICCPKDPNLAMELKMMTACCSREKICAWLTVRSRSRGIKSQQSHRQRYNSISDKKITEEDLTTIVNKLWLPFFRKTSKRNLQKSEEIYPLKEFQMDLAKQQTEESTDEKLFPEASVKEKKPKYVKKKPNSGKAPNAIRKTQKPARL